MNKLKHKLSENALIPFFFIAILQIILITIVNFTRSEKFLDFDSALALRHAIEIWKNGSIVLPNYNLTSCLELDCVSFWGAPIYMKTGDLSLAYGIVHFILLAIITIQVFSIFKKSKMKMEYGAIALVLILTPYTLGQLDYANMLFFSAGQYSFRAILVLLTINIFLTEKMKSADFIINSILYFVFITITTLSVGVYVPMMIISPFAVYLFFNALANQKLNLRDFRIYFLIASYLYTFLIIFYRTKCMGVDIGKTSVLISGFDAIENVLRSINSIFLFLGGVTIGLEIPLATVSGLLCIAKILFTIALICIPIYTIKKKQLIKNSKLIFIAVSFILCHFFILSISDSPYQEGHFESRYHLFWIIVLFITCTYCLKFFLSFQNKAFKTFFILSLYAFVFVSNAIMYKRIYFYENLRYDESCSIVEIAEEQDCETILLQLPECSSEKAHIIRALDDDKTCFDIDYKSLSAGTLDFYKGSADGSKLDGRSIFFTDDKTFSKLPKYIKNRYTKIGSYEKTSYYVTDNNPWDFTSGFPIYENTSIDYPYSSNVKTSNGIITDEGTFISNGKSGEILKYPYFIQPDISDYTYSIKINYKLETPDSPCTMEFLLDGKPVQSVQLDAENTSAAIEGIEIDLTNCASLKVTSAEGSKIEIISLEYERKLK